MVAAFIVAPLATAVIDVTGLAATLALLVMPLVLIAAILYAYRSAKPARPADKRRPDAAETRGDDMRAPDAARTESADTGRSAPPQPATPEIDWPERIRKAEAKADPVPVAEVYLAWGREEIARGSVASASEHLRTAIGFAAKGKAGALHAEARLELAELARSAGDLTTACEHWQLARALFHELQQRERVGDTERLMQRHGCPTDWVLNDF